MSSVTTLSTFDVGNFIERLQPSKESKKYICPIGGSNDSSITPAPNKAPDDKCFSNKCDERDITEAMPLAEREVATIARLIAIAGTSLFLYSYQGV